MIHKKKKKMMFNSIDPNLKYKKVKNQILNCVEKICFQIFHINLIERFLESNRINY